MIDFRNDHTVESQFRGDEMRQQLIGQVVTVRSIYDRKGDTLYPTWVIFLNEGPGGHTWPKHWFVPMSPLAHLVSQYRG